MDKVQAVQPPPLLRKNLSSMIQVDMITDQVMFKSLSGFVQLCSLSSFLTQQPHYKFFLGLNIVGNVYANVSTQLNSVYNKSSVVLRPFKGAICQKS